MPKEIYPSSYECDCGHQSHFFESTIRDLKQMSRKQRVLLGDSLHDKHTIVFFGGEMVDILCPLRDSRPALALPPMLRPLFWDYDFNRLSWSEDRDLIVSRVLTAGPWEAVRWLRAQMGDYALREWIEARRGRGLSPQRLRFWELILGLPHRRVSAWLAAEQQHVWQDRVRR